MCSLKCSPEGKLPLSQPGLPTVSLLRKVICSMLPSYNAGAFPEKAQLCHLSDTEVIAADLRSRVLELSRPLFCQATAVPMAPALAHLFLTAYCLTSLADHLQISPLECSSPTAERAGVLVTTGPLLVL